MDKVGTDCGCLKPRLTNYRLTQRGAAWIWRDPFPDPVPFKSRQHLPSLASPGAPSNHILYPSNRRRCSVLEQPPCHGGSERLGCFLGPPAHVVPEPVSLRGGELGKGAAWRVSPRKKARAGSGGGGCYLLSLSPFLLAISLAT